MQAILRKKNQKKSKLITLITIRSGFAHKNKAILKVRNRHFICALGWSGISSRKIEGDGATPLSTMALVSGFFQAGIKNRPHSLLPMRQIKAYDGWCDDRYNANYNRFVHLPIKASAEQLARTDTIYDIGIILDWNYKKRIKNRGSAIFMHIARADFSATQGCIAISRRDMGVLLPHLSNKTRMQLIK